MKHVVKSHRRANFARRPNPYRPHVEILEDRLPPGDTMLGAYLAWSWSVPSRHSLGNIPSSSQTGRAEALVVQSQPAQLPVTSSRVTENQPVVPESRSADEKVALFDLDDLPAWDTAFRLQDD
jgi:hypothetical protein